MRAARRDCTVEVSLIGKWESDDKTAVGRCGKSFEIVVKRERRYVRFTVFDRRRCTGHSALKVQTELIIEDVQPIAPLSVFTSEVFTHPFHRYAFGIENAFVRNQRSRNFADAGLADTGCPKHQHTVFRGIKFRRVKRRVSASAEVQITVQDAVANFSVVRNRRLEAKVFT